MLAAHLQAGNVGAFTDHPDRDNPTARTLSERIDHLLSVRSFVCHDAATFSPGVQGLGNLLSMFDVGGYKSDANAWSCRMQMGGQVHAITHPRSYVQLTNELRKLTPPGSDV